MEHRGADINPIPLAAAPSNANKRQIPLPPPNYGPGGPGLLPPPPGLASYPPQGAPIGPAPEDQWPIGAAADQPQIKNLQVQCEKTHMRVNIEFDRPFYGMIFSKGHYSDPNCVHVRPGSGQLSATFDVYLNSCGMTSSANQVRNCFSTPLFLILIAVSLRFCRLLLVMELPHRLALLLKTPSLSSMIRSSRKSGIRPAAFAVPGRTLIK